MKTIDSLRQLIPGPACMLFALAAVSCQTTPNPADSMHIAMSSGAAKWMKVSSQPPTYYPRGVPADCPTGHWSGEWVHTGDERGTRYFIPLHGLGGTRRQALVHEALSARSGRKLAEVTAEDNEIFVRNVRNMTLFGPPTFAGLLFAGTACSLVGGELPEVDAGRLQKEWNTSKQPHR